MGRHIMRLLFCLCLLLTACGHGGNTDKDKQKSNVLNYVCPEFSASVKISQGGALLKWAHGQINLDRTPTQSGTKYTGQGGTYTRTSPEQAEFQIGGKKHDQCVTTSRLTKIGPHLRAVGPHKQWVLRLHDDQQEGQGVAQLIEISDQGGKTSQFKHIRLARPAKGQGSGPNVYGAEVNGKVFSVVAANTACTVKGVDRMPLTVTLKLGKKVLHGCGEYVE